MNNFGRVFLTCFFVMSVAPSVARAEVDSYDGSLEISESVEVVRLAYVNADVDILKVVLNRGLNETELQDAFGILVERNGFNRSARSVDQEKEMIAAFIESGLDINFVDDYGNSLLASAVIFRNTDLVDVLLERGAKLWNPNWKSFHGNSPSLLAAKYFLETDDTSLIIQLLEDCKFDPLEKSHDGRTPLQILGPRRAEYDALIAARAASGPRCEVKTGAVAEEPGQGAQPQILEGAHR